jgi:hypothetical protein
MPAPIARQYIGWIAWIGRQKTPGIVVEFFRSLGEKIVELSDDREVVMS